MNGDDYITEVERQLYDTKFYEKLDENPQEQFQKDIDEVLTNIEIAVPARENISPSGNGRIPIFYVLPKFHKRLDLELPLGYPGRPIVSGCGSLAENISLYVDSILKPHMESSPSYKNDKSDFIIKIHNLKEFLIMDFSNLICYIFLQQCSS